ncbi:MAG: hypothetical protein IKJ93_03025 [Clostridia bacterium]|nr:hypothetical protein [Clostridia bacterium]
MENSTQETVQKNMYFSICITQIICICAIIIAVLIIKFFFPHNFTKLKTWCSNNVLEQTKIAAYEEGDGL